MTEESKNKIPQKDYEIDTLTNDRLIADHEYDGIRELDNDLPPWWKWLFYICIVFGIVYMVRFWGFNSEDLIQEAEYQAQMAEAEANRSVESKTFEIVLLTDAESLANGKATWESICSACHLVNGAGIVGPNMTDDYWIHGNTLEGMFGIVSDGILEKGMISYKDQLSPNQRLEVIAYIIGLHGTNPENGKAPEGEIHEWPY